MQKHLLVTIGTDPSALYGCRFVQSFFGHGQDVKITLFTVTPAPPEAYDRESFQSLDNILPKDSAQVRKGKAAVAKAKQDFVAKGWDPEMIDSKVQVRNYSKVSDIIVEGNRGLYDAVVLGRRGATTFETLLDESVTKTMLETRVDFPVWVCRDPDPERTGVLLCLDGSDESFTMADHVGFMLADQPRHNLRLLRVETPKPANPASSADIFEKTMKLLTGNGVDPARVTTLTVKSSSPSQTIIQEAQRAKTAVVAMGRTGAGAGRLSRIFMGSKCLDVHRKLKGAVQWACQ